MKSRGNTTPTMRGKQKDTSKQAGPQNIKNAIQIMCEDQMLSVCANTFEEREKWIEALEDITQVKKCRKYAKLIFIRHFIPKEVPKILSFFCVNF
jgi:hypothetical protein